MDWALAPLLQDEDDIDISREEDIEDSYRQSIDELVLVLSTFSRALPRQGERGCGHIQTVHLLSASPPSTPRRTRLIAGYD